MMTSRPDRFRRSAVTGSIGAVIGAIVAGLLSGNYVYAAMGTLIGAALSEILALFLPAYPWRNYATAKNLTNLVAAGGSMLLTMAGVVGFFKTGNWVLALGALFFLACGVFLFTHRE